VSVSLVTDLPSFSAAVLDRWQSVTALTTSAYLHDVGLTIPPSAPRRSGVCLRADPDRRKSPTPVGPCPSADHLATDARIGVVRLATTAPSSQS
jgi:hypothetical protein